MCAGPSSTTCAIARASRPASRKSWPDPASGAGGSGHCSEANLDLLAACFSRRHGTRLQAPGDSMPLSFDPQTLPVLGVDEHLPPVRADELSAAALRKRFAAPPVWTPE